ncbi:MAG: flagellar export protein FliJ [Nitratireductor sp.]|nr:flagellar export protein FliJ [Nitratireductor sp.]MCB1457496.1 flagellar export protein FliJ [Nitratireductor sp.]MCB1458748.1 flagellar export protein FliJ [Nitratireductor sp.]
MKSRDNLLRLKHFQVQDRTRQLAQIDMMIHEMTRMSDDLQAQIRIEEEKSGISDVSHFAYPTFAKAARQRHENLLVSIRDLNDKRQAAEDALGEAEEDLKKAQALESRDGTSAVSDQVVDAQVERRAMIG